MFSRNLSSVDKIRINRSFSKAALQYEAYASLQRETAEELLKSIIIPLTSHLSPITNALDIGCGTGFLTYGLSQILSETRISGCDISHRMIEAAKGQRGTTGHGKAHFLVADGESLPFQDEAFHVAVSNLAFQWMPDLEAGFFEVYRVLKPGGIVAFSIPGPKTLKELRRCYAEASEQLKKNGLPPFIQFASSESVTKTLEKAGFSDVSVRTEEHIQIYPDMWTLLKTIKSLGAGNPFKRGDHSLACGAILKKMAEVYATRFGIRTPDRCIRGQGSEFGVKKLFQGNKHAIQPGICATYEIMYVCGRK